MRGHSNVAALLLASLMVVLLSGCCQTSGCCRKCPRRADVCPEMKTTHGTLSVLHLRGTWYEMGLQYGKLMKDEMTAVRDFAALLNPKPSDPILLPKGLPCGIGFLDELMAGAAEGAGLTLDDMAIINGLEITYIPLCDEDAKAYAGKCTGLQLFGSKTKGGKRLYGRNYDWLSSFLPLGLTVTYLHPVGCRQEIAFINYPGCFYLTTGMNSSGLFLELNDGSYASKETDSRRIHNAWMLWAVLLQTRNVPEAVTLLQSLSPRGSYIIGLEDPKANAFFEWGVPSTFVHEGEDATGILAMTNHFVRPDWQNTEDAEWGGIISSLNRRQAILNLASKVPEGTGDVDTMKQLCSVPVEEGGAKWKGTLFQVIAVPEDREMLIHCCNSDEWIPVHF